MSFRKEFTAAMRWKEINDVTEKMIEMKENKNVRLM